MTGRASLAALGVVLLVLDPAASRGDYVLAFDAYSLYPPEVRVRWRVRPPRKTRCRSM